jgi:pyruvate dehydrogenase E1 component alpha subunit
VTREALKSLLETMLLIRLFEERVEELYSAGAIGGTTHLSIGQEAVAAGILSALAAEDLIVSHHRGHGHLLARGGDPRRLMAELLGKRDGYCRGRGGSQHVSVIDRGFFGTNGITGGGIPVATGAALARKRLGQPGIVVCFFGDGAANQGMFHESLNMAALWKLPVLYVCENNHYAMSTPIERAAAVPDLALRGAPYGIPAETTDGMDVARVQAAARAAAAHVRGEGAPFLLVPGVYRSREEEDAWRARDPLTLAAAAFEAAGGGAEELDRLRARAAERVAEACRFAEASPPADPRTATEGVYADG